MNSLNALPRLAIGVAVALVTLTGHGAGEEAKAANASDRQVAAAPSESLEAVIAAFKARHPDLTPEIEKQIIDLGDSGEIVPGNMTPDAYLEKLYETVMARQASEPSDSAWAEADLAAVQAKFKTRHNITPEIEKQIVELGNSHTISPGNMTPDEFLEKLYETVMARAVAQTELPIIAQPSISTTPALLSWVCTVSSSAPVRVAPQGGARATGTAPVGIRLQVSDAADGWARIVSILGPTQGSYLPMAACDPAAAGRSRTAMRQAARALTPDQEPKKKGNGFWSKLGLGLLAASAVAAQGFSAYEAAAAAHEGYYRTVILAPSSSNQGQRHYVAGSSVWASGNGCECACVDSRVQAICGNSMSMTPICPSRMCPIAPSSARPFMPLNAAPPGTTQCAMHQVLDDTSGKYAWKKLCF